MAGYGNGKGGSSPRLEVSASFEFSGAGRSPFANQTTVFKGILLYQMESKKSRSSLALLPLYNDRKPKAKSPEGESHEQLPFAAVREDPTVMSV
ncbi:hypothetical protein EUGRSUZ_L01213 [Eucalyptus grandis]|uniref:Uncharacterized protein n=1 Tax=Eucalyptus grandis TaxID=71139 RepID=A0A058ZUM9_EUCGR|nr:hypothetical protein EUGRSUZ_L01213 [Eucalyptus grandis]